MKEFLRYLLTAAAAILALMAVAIVPLGGVASAASNKSNCPNGEGGPFCILVISAPESVVAGQPFTVKVFVTTDGTTLARSDPCGSKALVTLDVSQGDSFTEYSARASGAVATFTVTVTDPGSFSLEAFAGEEGGPCGNTFYESDFAEGMAISVAAGQPIAPCPPDEVCVQTTNNDAGGSSAATLFADTGTFDFAFFEAFDNQGCVTPPTDPINGVLDFFYEGTSQKTIVFALAPGVVNKGIGQFNICWESKKPFMVQGGGQAAGPNGNGYFVGFLPNCSPHVGPPCVLSKTGTQHDGAFFTVLAPAPDPSDPPGTGDPKGYP
jgi:hypothetical protein